MTTGVHVNCPHDPGGADGNLFATTVCAPMDALPPKWRGVETRPGAQIVQDEFPRPGECTSDGCDCK